MTSTINHIFIDLNGIQLHVVQAGPVRGPLVILLHGFPEFWYGWRHQIDDLANAGFCVWVPDQRGYNLSDKPKGVGSYAIDTLAADVVSLIEAAGRQKAILVGHDWGAAVAWWTAVVYPEWVDRLVTVNVPHPVVMSKFARKSVRQMLRSWYIGFFQLPWLPERLMRLGNWYALTRAMRTTGRPGTFTDAELEQYKAAWSQPGAFTAMVNWYRAALQFPLSRRPSIRVTVPTLLIWGVKDRFLKREMAQFSIDLCDNGRVVFLENATHWVQHEEAERVNKLIREG